MNYWPYDHIQEASKNILHIPDKLNLGFKTSQCNTFPLLKQLAQIVLHEVVAIHANQSYVVKPYALLQ
jgi:hypothetical protein